MLTRHGPWLPGLPAGTGGGMGQPCAKALFNFCLHGVGGLGTPQSTPHLSSCVCTSLDTSSEGVCDSESPIMFLLVWLGFACQGVNPPLLLASGTHTCKRVLWSSWGSWHA